MDYVKITFKLDPVISGREVLYADLEVLGAESIIDTDFGAEAYLQVEFFNEDVLDNLMVAAIPNQKVEYEVEIIEQQNWNATWESQFQPITINDKCVIRAPFHEDSGLEFDIVISPKMSFGTGHHETTFLMSQELFDHDLNGKSVMDMGCGTGVLAILAKKIGAGDTEGIDIEEWAYENSVENAELNGVPTVKFFQGDIEKLKGKKFEVILANINRNILLADMSEYSRALVDGGKLFLSGFYETDVDTIVKAGNENGLKFVFSKIKNGWAMVHLMK